MDASQVMKFLMSLPDEAIAVLAFSLDEEASRLKSTHTMSEEYLKTFDFVRSYVNNEWERRDLWVAEFFIGEKSPSV